MLALLAFLNAVSGSNLFHKFGRKDVKETEKDAVVGQ